MDFLIPTCGLSPHLEPLLRELKESPDTGSIMVIINNVDSARAMELARLCWRVEALPAYWGQGVNIYRMWNYGIRVGKETGHHVGILNDDVWLDHRTILPMSQILDSRRAIAGWDHVHTNMTELIRVQHVRGTYRKGGIGGFAFAVNPKLVELIDERFQWWGGDDDLVNQTRKNGWQVVVGVGLGVIHHYSTSTVQRPVHPDIIAADRALMLDKWGEAW